MGGWVRGRGRPRLFLGVPPPSSVSFSFLCSFYPRLPSNSPTRPATQDGDQPSPHCHRAWFVVPRWWEWFGLYHLGEGLVSPHSKASGARAVGPNQNLLPSTPPHDDETAPKKLTKGIIFSFHLQPHDTRTQGDDHCPRCQPLCKPRTRASAHTHPHPRQLFAASPSFFSSKSSSKWV